MDDCRSNARVHRVATQFNGRTQKIVELAQLNNVFVPDPDISEESDVDIEEMDNQFQDNDSDQSSLPPTLTSSLQDLLAELEEEEQQGKVPDLSNLNLDNILEEDLNEIVRPTDNLPASSSFNIDDNTTATTISTAITYASSSSSCKRKRQCKSSANKETKKRKLPSKQICKNTFNFTRDPFNGNIDNVLVDKFDVPQEIPIETDYFYKMFSEDIFELIVLRTNQRSVHETGASINTTKAEIKDFIAIHLLMGVIQLPSYLDYWSRQFRVPKIADVMPLKRYQKLRKYVRFVDPTETSTDRYFKLKPVIDIIRKNCRNIVNEKQQSIDEMMAPFKGTRAGSRKQYIKSKPHKWGFKIFVRSGVSGIVYDFIVYGEEISLPGIEEEFGLGGKVILKLCKTIPEPCLTAIYFDNFFTSLELLHYLRETYGILALGTIRSNRLRGCEIGMKQKKVERGYSIEMADNEKKVVIVKWTDNKEVLLASNFVGKHPLTTVTRFSKTEGRKIEIPCPKIVKEYNKHMGGVDLSDMLISLYRTGIKANRWYLSLFSHLLDLCINNAWLLMRRDCKLIGKSCIRLKEFRARVAEGLANKDKPSRRKTTPPAPKTIIQMPTVPRPVPDVRYDGLHHFPECVPKGRCRLCTGGQTRIGCTKCNVRLCLIPERNCFQIFHRP